MAMESERLSKLSPLVAFGRCLDKSVTYNLHLQKCRLIGNDDGRRTNLVGWLSGCRSSPKVVCSERAVVVWCQTQGPSDHRCERRGFISGATTYFRCFNVLN